MQCNMEKNQIWDHEINIMYHATCIKFGEIDILVAYLSTSLFHDKSSQNLELVENISKYIYVHLKKGIDWLFFV